MSIHSRIILVLAPLLFLVAGSRGEESHSDERGSMEASALASGREALEAVERRLGAPLRVHRVTLDRHSVDVGRPRFRVHVEGPRAGGYVEFRLDGRRGRVVRW